MAQFKYIAKREIKSGHTAGTEYTITTVLQKADGEMPEPVLREHKSISGAAVTVLHRIEKYLNVTTDYVAVDGSGTPDVDDFLEFFNSVAGGEEFIYNDGADHDAMMAGKPTRSRNGIYFSYSFKFRFL